MDTTTRPFCLVCRRVAAFCRGMCRGCYEDWRKSRPGFESEILNNRRRAKEWALAHPERKKELYQKYKSDASWVERHRARQRAYHAANPRTEEQRIKDAVYRKEYARRTVLKRWSKRIEKQYGLTAVEWDRMLVECGGRCCLCEQPLILPVVDHDHVTGKVRGLLCRYCNRWLGTIEKYPFMLEKISEYLKRG